MLRVCLTSVGAILQPVAPLPIHRLSYNVSEIERGRNGTQHPGVHTVLQLQPGSPFSSLVIVVFISFHLSVAAEGRVFQGDYLELVPVKVLL